MKKIIVIGLSLVALLVLATIPTLVSAGSPTSAVFNQDACQDDTSICGGDAGGLIEVLMIIINTMIFVAGIIAVIMIIVGGIKYATSAGDTNQITGAKNTILYSVVGLVVAIMSFAIVNFVLDQFVELGGGSGSSSEESQDGTGGSDYDFDGDNIPVPGGSSGGSSGGSGSDSGTGGGSGSDSGSGSDGSTQPSRPSRPSRPQPTIPNPRMPLN